MKQITFEQVPETLSRVLTELTELKGLMTQSQSTTPQEKQDQLFCIDEAATFLKLAKPTIYGMVSRSEIPYSKKGKRLYFSKQELADWIKEGRKKTNAEIQQEATNYINRNKR